MTVRVTVEEITTLSPRRTPVTIRNPRDPRYAERRVTRALMRILRADPLCSIATVTPQGRAHICHLYFCWSPEVELYFLSDPASAHCQHLTGNPSMAATVYRSDQPWAQPGRGLQLWGRCVEATGLHARLAERTYANRFRGYAAYRAADPTNSEAGFRYRFYRFTPRKLKILDERVFGGGVFVTASIRR